MDQFSEELKAKQAANRNKDLNLLNMIESRIMEIVLIERECKRKLPKLYNQRLPRFMRRRAASHNTKRLPKRSRPPVGSSFGTKDRTSLNKYRRRLRFRKHKRVLRKHKRANYPEKPDKCLLHKWFAKRFKMVSIDEMEHLPLHNNTKNLRNLYRQSIYGCGYLSLAHLIPIHILLSPSHESNLLKQVDCLNRLTHKESGFTFSARSLANGKYEVCVHLFEPNSNNYICPASVSIRCDPDTPHTLVVMWLPRKYSPTVLSHLQSLCASLNESLRFVIKPKQACDIIRMRLFGPDARTTAVKLCDQPIEPEELEDFDQRVSRSFGISIGKLSRHKYHELVIYNTRPSCVDVIFKGKQGRLMWYKLIRNKSHLVGGFRDIDLTLTASAFKMIPDDRL